MTYTELITKIKEPMLPTEYYKLLLAHPHEITIQIANTSKKQVADDLGMTPQVFATAIKFITAVL